MDDSDNNQPEKSTATVSVPADHPALEGHFPGDPVVPGVMILELVSQLVESSYPQAKLRRIPHAKFIAPLKPGQHMCIETTRNGSVVRFCCRHGADIISNGDMVFSFEE